MQRFDRKRNRLVNYDYSQDGAYFVTICSKDMKCLFGSIKKQKDSYEIPVMILSNYGKVVEKYIQSINGIFQYIIMPNHIHLIIIINNNDSTVSSHKQSLSQRIQSFKILVSKEIGVSVWHRSFYDHIIRTEKSFNKISDYIYNNIFTWEKDILYDTTS